jgi:hypothetical protein
MRLGRRRRGSGFELAGNWQLATEAGSWKLEAGSWKPEAGSWKPEAGSWKLDSVTVQ